MVTMLGVGVLSVEPVQGEFLEFFLSGGFATVRENTLIVLADECESASEIDREEAWEAIAKARAMGDDTEKEYDIRNKALDVARKRFALVQKKGKGKRENHAD